MRRLTKILFGALALFYFQPGWGLLPVYQREITTPPATDSLGQVPYPFLGGISSPRAAVVDIDNDGDLDLFLLRQDGQLNFFRNAGTPTLHSFVLEKQNLVDTLAGTWFRFADIDGDGKKDLFCDNSAAGMRYYQNTSVNLSQTPAFSLISPAFQNIVTEFINIPAFTDIDNDGDLDFFAGRISGTLAFYRNDGTAASPNFVHITDTYDSLSTFETAPPCTANVVSPPLPEFTPLTSLFTQTNLSRSSSSGHGANSIDFADVNADGDYDFFWGDINNINLYFFENQGTPAVSDLVKNSNCYLPFETNGFNTPSFGDLDGDADQDILVSSFNQGMAKNNLAFLRNVGTAVSPNFSIVTKNLLRGIDVGVFAFTQLVDIDGDCDRDLLIGSSANRIYFFRNNGNPASSSFDLASANFGGINESNVFTVIPVFADIDADGDFDLFIGKDNGTTSFYRNTGTASSPAFTLVTPQYLDLTVNTNPVFAFADIDADGDLDLFVGEWRFTGNANVRFYRNEGSAQSAAFVLEQPQLIPPASRIQTIPALADYDGDGDLDLFVGSRDGTIQLFQNDGTPDTFNFTPVAGSYVGVDVGFWAAPFFSDIDGDGDLDLFVGTEEGGVFFYRNTATPPFFPGDLNGDAAATPSDVVLLLNAVFTGNCLAPFRAGDLSCDGMLTPSDIVVLLNVVFLGASGVCP